MKKRLVALFCGMTMCVSLALGSMAVCAAEQEPGNDGKDVSSEEETAEERVFDTTPLAEGVEDYADCVVLPDYSKFEFTKKIDKITDEYVDEYLAKFRDAELLEDENAVVQQGDTVNVAYDGTTIGESVSPLTKMVASVCGGVKAKDGGAGSGMSSSGYDLRIGSHMFIDGFEEGLIGKKAGQKCMLTLAFPENYGNEELDGKDVVFMVTVNSISRPAVATDEWAKEHSKGKYETVDEYHKATKEELEQKKLEDAEAALQTEIWGKILEEAEFKQLPADVVEYNANEYEANVRQNAENYGLDIRSMLEEEGKDMSYFDKLKEDYGRSIAKSTVLLAALAKEEGIEKGSPEFKAGMEKLLEKNNVDEKTLRENFSDEEVDNSAMTIAVLDKIIQDLDVKEEYVDPEN